jgi:hypothetical protein
MIQDEIERRDRQRASRNLTGCRVPIFEIDLNNRPAILGRNGAASDGEPDILEGANFFSPKLFRYFSDPLRDVEEPFVMIGPGGDGLAATSRKGFCANRRDAGSRE